MTGNGAFLVETRPINSTTWRAQSKDHIVQDPHYLKVYAIGMRIDGVDPSYLRSKIHIVSATGSSDSWPSASISVPVNCILVGGGAIDNYTGYGNMLTDSHPISNEWNAGGKDYRRVDESTITVYAIGIENISYPTVGYLYVTTNQTAAGINLGIGYCNAEVNSGFALTCPGGYDTWHNYGRMLVGLYPQDLVPSTEVISNDTPGYGDYGTNYAFAVGIEQRPW